MADCLLTYEHNNNFHLWECDYVETFLLHDVVAGLGIPPSHQDITGEMESATSKARAQTTKLQGYARPGGTLR